MKSELFEKKDSLIKVIFFYVVLVVMLIATIYPMLNVLTISLRPQAGLFSSSLSIIPTNATLDNYMTVLFNRPFMRWMLNSFIAAASTSILGVLLSISAAYAFSRFKFYGKNPIMIAFLITYIFPAPMTLLPMYLLLKSFHLIGTFQGIIVPYIATSVPFSVWVLKGFFDTVPASIEESAFVDGAGLFQIFYKIIIPLSLPAIGVVALNAFMLAWSEYVVARVVLPKEEMKTLPVALVGMTGYFNTDWGIYSAASLMTAIPVMAIFMSMSKFFVGGLTLGGVKG